jgi:hypothetical protein
MPQWRRGNAAQGGALVDQKSREALSGRHAERSRQLLFAALLLADQIVDGKEFEIPKGPDELINRTSRLAERLKCWPTPLREAARTPR